MQPWVTLATALAPGGATLSLVRRGDTFVIRVGHAELMSSHMHGSEERLAEFTCTDLPPRASILIGGLGMGFTLRAALDALPATAKVDVVEIVPALVQWNRTLLASLAGSPLDDPRVTVIEADVAEVIKTAKNYDAIVLDVDNGPDAVYDGNAGLYKRRGLEAAKRALAPGGVLAVWSAFKSNTFTHWLRETGFATELVTMKSKFKGGPTHYVWFARRP